RVLAARANQGVGLRPTDAPREPERIERTLGHALVGRLANKAIDDRRCRARLARAGRPEQGQDRTVRSVPGGHGTKLGMLHARLELAGVERDAEARRNVLDDLPDLRVNALAEGGLARVRVPLFGLRFALSVRYQYLARNGGVEGSSAFV